jgi:hypothetical protein
MTMERVVIIRYVIFGILLVIGLLLLSRAINAYLNTSSFLAKTITAQGTVVDLAETKSGSKIDTRNYTIYYRPVVSFTTKDGKLIEFTSASGTNPPSYAKGDKLEVLYFAAEPQKAEIHGFMSLWGTVLVSGIIGAMFLLAGGGVLVVSAVTADPAVTASSNESNSFKGNLAPGKEDSWTVVIKSGKEARLQVVKGQREISVDIYDSQNLAANEGVSEADWFPVEPGQYKISLTNVSNLGNKSRGHDVAYEINLEIK